MEVTFILAIKIQNSLVGRVSVEPWLTLSAQCSVLAHSISCAGRYPSVRTTRSGGSYLRPHRRADTHWRGWGLLG